MKRFEIIQHYNNMYLLPALHVNYEKGWYKYICLSWIKWSIEFKVYNKEEQQ